MRRSFPLAFAAKTLAAAAALLLGLSAQAQKTQLLVYTALETDQLKAYQEGFNKVEPNIEIKWVRDSTGVITAKLLAEKANPQADVVWGLAATSLMLLDKEGMLAAYAPKGVEQVRPSMRDPRAQPRKIHADGIELRVLLVRDGAGQRAGVRTADV